MIYLIMLISMLINLLILFVMLYNYIEQHLEFLPFSFNFLNSVYCFSSFALVLIFIMCLYYKISIFSNISAKKIWYIFKSNLKIISIGIFFASLYLIYTKISIYDYYAFAESIDSSPVLDSIEKNLNSNQDYIQKQGVSLNEDTLKETEKEEPLSYYDRISDFYYSHKTACDIAAVVVIRAISIYIAYYLIYSNNSSSTNSNEIINISNPIINNNDKYYVSFEKKAANEVAFISNISDNDLFLINNINNYVEYSDYIKMYTLKNTYFMSNEQEIKALTVLDYINKNLNINLDIIKSEGYSKFSKNYVKYIDFTPELYQELIPNLNINE